MAKNITIKVPGKHPQTCELTTFELKGQRMDIDIGVNTDRIVTHPAKVKGTHPLLMVKQK